MSATVTTTITTTIQGLSSGSNQDSLVLQFSPAAPTASFHNYKIVTVAGTAEKLDVGSLTTVTGIWIQAIAYDLQVDPTNSGGTAGSFVAKILIPAGQAAYFRPASGAEIWVNSASSAGYEYLLFG